MQVREEEIYQITKNVWDTVLGLGMERRPEQWKKQAVPHFLTGYVRITGAWHGVFSLDCSFALARRIAAVMFRFDTVETSSEDIRDALGELANITGGNIKGLLPEPCRLALPVVVTEGSSFALALPSVQVVTQVNFECEQEPFRVTLLSLPEEPRLNINSGKPGRS